MGHYFTEGMHVVPEGPVRLATTLVVIYGF